MIKLILNLNSPRKQTSPYIHVILHVKVHK